MKYNFLGNTGLLVSELCFGTMTFGGKGFWESMGKTQQKEVNELIKAVVDAEINFIDTANVYSYGEAEKLLGKSIKDLGLHRNELVIATKVRGIMSSAPNDVGLSRYHIFNAVDDSLKRLQLDHIDILYVHGADLKTSMEETMRALNDIVITGKVRYIAICNWPAWMVVKAQGIAERNGWHKFIGLQYYYSIVTRDIEHELVPMAKDQHLAILPWSPLAGGFLSGKFTRDNQKAEGSRRDEFDFPPIDKEKAYDIVDVELELGKKYGVSAAQIALAWVRQQPGITSTIIGARHMDQLKDNMASTEVTLTDEDLEKINEVSPLPKQYPGWMVDRQSGDRR